MFESPGGGDFIDLLFFKGHGLNHLVFRFVTYLKKLTRVAEASTVDHSNSERDFDIWGDDE